MDIGDHFCAGTWDLGPPLVDLGEKSQVFGRMHGSGWSQARISRAQEIQPRGLPSCKQPLGTLWHFLGFAELAQHHETLRVMGGLFGGEVGRDGHMALRPPSTGMAWPVMKVLAGSQSETMTVTTSSAEATRRIGTRLAIRP